MAKVAALKVGDNVKTVGGVYGTVVEIVESANCFILETGKGDNKSTIIFDRNAIYEVESAPDTIETKEEPPKE
jgi:preprotein translocase subunit YajC